MSSTKKVTTVVTILTFGVVLCKCTRSCMSLQAFQVVLLNIVLKFGRCGNITMFYMMVLMIPLF